MLEFREWDLGLSPQGAKFRFGLRTSVTLRGILVTKSHDPLCQLPLDRCLPRDL